MPFDMSWLVQNHVILSVGWGDSDLDEFREANRIITEFIHEGLASGSKSVHLYVNLSYVRRQANPFEAAGLMTIHHEKGLGYIVNTGRGNSLVVRFANFLARATHYPIHFFDEPEHALSFLQMKDPLLPELLPLYLEKMKTIEKKHFLSPGKQNSIG